MDISNSPKKERKSQYIATFTRDSIIRQQKKDITLTTLMATNIITLSKIQPKLIPVKTTAINQALTNQDLLKVYSQAITELIQCQSHTTKTLAPFRDTETMIIVSSLETRLKSTLIFIMTHITRLIKQTKVSYNQDPQIIL